MISSFVIKSSLFRLALYSEYEFFKNPYPSIVPLSTETNG